MLHNPANNGLISLTPATRLSIPISYQYNDRLSPILQDVDQLSIIINHRRTLAETYVGLLVLRFLFADVFVRICLCF